MKDSAGKLGFGALTAIVLGMMVGSGIFNLPQNMAAHAAPLAVGISWLITAAGMIMLVATFKILADRRPDLNAGIYQYAQSCFGNYAGFNVAWGYWLCTAFANVAYAVMLNDSFGAFFPSLLTHGWPTLLFGTTLIWVMYFIVSAGVRTAHALNTALTVIKVISLALVVVLLIIGFDKDLFIFNLSEIKVSGAGLWEQVSSSMLVTLWCFIGIEGAVMLAADARRPRDVGKATVAGFLIAWVLYALVSLLCYGAMHRAQLAGLHDPSVANVLRNVFGDWAYWAIIISVILSILGVWVAWTIIGAELPYEAAKVGIFPKSFMHLNRHGLPKQGLLLSSIIMQGFFIVVLFSEDVYLTTLSITGMMILPAYLASGIFLWREAVRGRELRFHGHRDRMRCMGIGIICTIFCIWMIYAGGWRLLTFTAWFYLVGTGIYLKARGEEKSRGCCTDNTTGATLSPRFNTADKLTLAVLVASAVISAILLVSGFSPF